VELQTESTPCRAGLCFGSRHPAPEAAIFDTWPRCRLADMENLEEIAGILAFDVWTGNRDFRQLRFMRPRNDSGYRMIMFDNGDAFGRNEWTFVDKPRLAIHPCVYLYEHIDGIDAFEPWLSRIEAISETELLKIACLVPSEWCDFDVAALNDLLRGLHERRAYVRRLLTSLRMASPKVFPAWNISVAAVG